MSKKETIAVLAGVEEDNSQPNVSPKYPVLWETGRPTFSGARVQVLTGRDGGRLTPLRTASRNFEGRHALFHIFPGVHCIVLEYSITEKKYRGYVWKLDTVVKAPPKPKTGEWMTTTIWSRVDEVGSDEKGAPDFIDWERRFTKDTLRKFAGALTAAEKKIDAIITALTPAWALDVHNPMLPEISGEIPDPSDLDTGHPERTPVAQKSKMPNSSKKCSGQTITLTSFRDLEKFKNSRRG